MVIEPQSTLSKDRINEIEYHTWDLLKEVYGEKPIVPPINLNALVEKAGLQIKQGNFLNTEISGAYDKANKVIYVNAIEPYVRKAFTVAHELGHFYLHQDKPIETFYRRDLQSIIDEHRCVEKEANWFAASLLMPKPAISALWFFIGDLHELANRCDVSATALHYRLKNLGLLDQDEEK